MKFSPKFDSEENLIGTNIVHVIESNPEGSILEILKKKMIQKQTEALLVVTEHLRKVRAWIIAPIIYLIWIWNV